MPNGSVGPTFTSRPPGPNGRKFEPETAKFALPMTGLPTASMPGTAASVVGEPRPANSTEPRARSTRQPRRTVLAGVVTTVVNVEVAPASTTETIVFVLACVVVA